MSEAMKAEVWRKTADRRYFIGGSDARIIMGDDEAGLLRLFNRKTCRAISLSSSVSQPRT
jgi:predicted phage-related endonuclease